MTASDPVVETPSRWTRFRGVAMAGVVGVCIVALAFVFANAQSVEQVATQGQAGIEIETALSTSATPRNRTVQALVIASAVESGSATTDQAGRAIEGAGEALEALETQVEGVTTILRADVATAIRASTTRFAAAIRTTIDLIVSGDIAAADRTIATDLEPAYEVLAGDLLEERQAHVDRIGLARSDSGRIANAARFLVAFVVPLGAILAVRRAARRRQRNLLLRKELERERAVGRTKDEFIANLSHELRTPLTGIYGFAMAMIDTGVEDPFAAEMAGIIAGESAELSRMVDDLLTAAAADHKGVAITIEPADAAPESIEVVAPFRVVGHEPEVDVEPASVLVDRLRLRQILRNLISNAVKHGGPTIRLIGRIHGDLYVFEVADDGDGVPEHVEDRMFQRFVHQGDQPLLTGSVGLGLSIVELLTTAMGGTITYGRQDGWTVFALEFPLAEAPRSAPEPEPAAEPPDPVWPRSASVWEPGRAPVLGAAVSSMSIRRGR